MLNEASALSSSLGGYGSCEVFREKAEGEEQDAIRKGGMGKSRARWNDMYIVPGL